MAAACVPRTEICGARSAKERLVVIFCIVAYYVYSELQKNFVNSKNNKEEALNPVFTERHSPDRSFRRERHLPAPRQRLVLHWSPSLSASQQNDSFGHVGPVLGLLILLLQAGSPEPHGASCPFPWPILPAASPSWRPSSLRPLSWPGASGCPRPPLRGWSPPRPPREAHSLCVPSTGITGERAWGLRGCWLVGWVGLALSLLNQRVSGEAAAVQRDAMRRTASGGPPGGAEQRGPGCG